MATLVQGGDTISQSKMIGGMLIVGFLVWLLIQGRLAAYWSILLGGGGTATPKASGSSDTGPQTGTASGTVLTGPGLTGQSTSTGQNVTSTPTIGNIFDWLKKLKESISGPQFDVIPPAK